MENKTKYKLIKKLNGISEGTEFKYYGGSFKITSKLDISFDEIMSLNRYIDLVGIDDKDSFEKIKEDALVPEDIKIEESCYGLCINRGKQSLYYLGGEYLVDKVDCSNLVKCKLVKTSVGELKVGDMFCDDIYKKQKLDCYNIYLGDGKLVYWDNGIKEGNYNINATVYKVVKV